MQHRAKRYSLQSRATSDTRDELMWYKSGNSYDTVNITEKDTCGADALMWADMMVNGHTELQMLNNSDAIVHLFCCGKRIYFSG